jgi:hypothetical protein
VRTRYSVSSGFWWRRHVARGRTTPSTDSQLCVCLNLQVECFFDVDELTYLLGYLLFYFPRRGYFAHGRLPLEVADNDEGFQSDCFVPALANAFPSSHPLRTYQAPMTSTAAIGMRAIYLYIYLVWTQRGAWLHRTTARSAADRGSAAKHPKRETVVSLCH